MVPTSGTLFLSTMTVFSCRKRMFGLQKTSSTHSAPLENVEQMLDRSPRGITYSTIYRSGRVPEIIQGR